jgi:purine-nucleoside phosphorylase
MAAGVLPRPLNHEEVLEMAKRVGTTFTALLKGVIARI